MEVMKDFIRKMRFFIDYLVYCCRSALFSRTYFYSKVKYLYKLLRILLWVIKMECPVCGGAANPTGKEFKFGVFDGKQHKCSACSKTFNAFYRDGKFTHTVPKKK